MSISINKTEPLANEFIQSFQSVLENSNYNFTTEEYMVAIITFIHLLEINTIKETGLENYQYMKKQLDALLEGYDDEQTI